MTDRLEELARVPMRRYDYSGAEIMVWVGVYCAHGLTGQQVVVGGLSAAVDGKDLALELQPDDSEPELLAKARQ